MQRKTELTEFTVEELLDELARRCAARVSRIHTTDLVSELMTREGVEVTIVDPYESARHCVEGPAFILTVFD